MKVVPRGAKPACTRTLEVQKLYCPIRISKLLMPLAGKTMHNFSFGGKAPPCPLQVCAFFVPSRGVPKHFSLGGVGVFTFRAPSSEVQILFRFLVSYSDSCD